MISIIIPVYNAGKYLTDSLNSIYLQNIKDWECILVDDGSTDNSNEICREWVNKDKRFHLYTQENKGVSSARNLGISKAKGKYIYFIDADDICKHKAFTYVNKETDVDVVVGEYESFNSNCINHHCHNDHYEKTNYALAYLKQDIKCRIGSFFVKKNILIDNNIYFNDKYKYGEDMDFIAKILILSKSVTIIKETFVSYRDTPNSAMSRFSINKFSVLFSRVNLIEFSKKNGNIEVASYLHNFSCIEAIISISRDLILHNHSISSLTNYFKENDIILYYLKQASKSELLDNFYKKSAWQLLHCPILFYIAIHLDSLHYKIRYSLGKIKQKTHV